MPHRKKAFHFIGFHDMFSYLSDSAASHCTDTLDWIESLTRHGWSKTFIHISNKMEKQACCLWTYSELHVLVSAGGGPGYERPSSWKTDKPQGQHSRLHHLKLNDSHVLHWSFFYLYLKHLLGYYKANISVKSLLNTLSVFPASCKNEASWCETNITFSTICWYLRIFPIQCYTAVFLREEKSFL